MYWTLPVMVTTNRAQVGFEEAVEETERLLVDSVRLRLDRRCAHWSAVFERGNRFWR